MRLKDLAAAVASEIEVGKPPSGIPYLNRLIGELRGDIHAFDPIKKFAEGDESKRSSALETCKAIVYVAEKSGDEVLTIAPPELPRKPVAVQQ